MVELALDHLTLGAGNGQLPAPRVRWSRASSTTLVLYSNVCYGDRVGEPARAPEASMEGASFASVASQGSQHTPLVVVNGHTNSMTCWSYKNLNRYSHRERMTLRVGKFSSLLLTQPHTMPYSPRERWLHIYRRCKHMPKTSLDAAVLLV